MRALILNRLREKLILLLLISALSAGIFHQAARLAPLNIANRRLFSTLSSPEDSSSSLRREWRPRILSLLTAKTFNQLAAEPTLTRKKHLKITVGLYAAFWLFLINLSFVVGFSLKKALFFIWGLFAAVSLGYMPGIVSRIYPWDLPALFFFSLFVVCYKNRLYHYIPYLILIGLGFKETTLVLCLSFLFMPKPKKQRLKYLIITLSAFCLLKIIIDLSVNNSSIFFSLTAQRPPSQTLRLLLNLKWLFTLKANPVFINAATLLALFLLPGRNKTIRMLKTIALSFTVLIFIFGVINEYRIWLEMAPLAIFALVTYLEQDKLGGWKQSKT